MQLVQPSSNSHTPKRIELIYMEKHLNGDLKAEYCKHKVFAYKRLAALGGTIGSLIFQKNKIVGAFLGAGAGLGLLALCLSSQK